MPRAPRTEPEFRAVKNSILEKALIIMTREGFDNLSMRRLGTATGMTAANIYNYFSGKDELYLELQTKGFEMLHDKMLEVCGRETGPLERLKGFVYAYYEFGTQFPEYYDIMFNRPTPKFTDYRGTELEPIASVEKETAMKTALLTVKTIEEYIKTGNIVPPFEPYRIMLETWCMLHGIITLYNSRVYQEVDSSFEEGIQVMLENIYKRFL